MKTFFSTSMAALVVSAALTVPEVAMSATGNVQPRLGESVTVGCTLPGGLNGSKVYSLDIANETNANILVPIDIGDNCQKALNNLTPKTGSGILFDVIQTNCGVSQSIPGQGNFLGVWQSAGQTPANSLVTVTGGNGIPGDVLTNLFFTQQMAPPGPAQPVLLMPADASSTYGLVSYSFVCALPTGTLTYLLVAQDIQPPN